MRCRLHSQFRLFVLLACSFFFVGCLEDERKVDLEDVKTKLDGVAFDKDSTRKFIDLAKVKLTELKIAERDFKKAGEINGSISNVTKTLEEVTALIDEVKASLEASELGFEDYQAKYRAKVRKDVVGKNLDLSATKGEDFKEVRVLSVNPVEIRIYQTSGPQSVPISEIPKEVREMLQMSEEEAEAHRSKLRDNAKVREERYKEWKEGLADRKSEAAQKAIAKRLKDIQTEVEDIENSMNLRLLKIQDLKSRSSQWQRDYSLARGDKRREKALGYSQMYRDKAQKLNDLNSDGHLVIARLRSEEEDLKKMQQPGG